MKCALFLCISILLSVAVFAQTENVKLTSKACENEEVRGLLDFQKIQYDKSIFSHKDLSNKSFKLKYKDIRNGKIFADSVLMDSKNLGMPYSKINDSIFTIKVYAQETTDHKLRVQIVFPRFRTEKNFNLIDDKNQYTLRNVADEGKFKIQFGKPFYFLSFFPPYKLDGGGASWCIVANDTQNIEKWGEKYGLKQYLLFELVFED